MKVYLIRGNHPLFESSNIPPEGVEYIYWRWISHGFSRYTEYKGNVSFKNFSSRIYNLLGLPRLYFVSKKCDMIHSSGALILNHKPWVVDVERAASFVGLQNEKLSEKRYKVKIEAALSSKYCKKIMPHSIASKRSIMSAFDTSKFINKLEVVYLAILPKQIINKHSGSKIRLLFATNRFYSKGGKELLQAFDILRKKFDLELIMRAPIPPGFKKKYEHINNITLLDEPIDRELLFELYTNSDIFVLPTYDDSFGYVFLEAMSVGLPLIGNDIFAVPEIIEDGKNGFLIRTPISFFGKDYLTQELPDLAKTNVPVVTEQLVEKISMLVEDTSLRRKMGRESYKLVKSGKFSIKQRNKKLLSIYKEALE